MIITGDKFANSPNVFSIGCNEASIDSSKEARGFTALSVASLPTGGVVRVGVGEGAVGVGGGEGEGEAVDISSICKEPKEQNDVTIGWGFLHILENLQQPIKQLFNPYSL